MRIREARPAAQLVELRGSASGDQAELHLEWGVHFPEAAELLGFLEPEGAWRKFAAFCLVEGVLARVEEQGLDRILLPDAGAIERVRDRIVNEALPWLEHLSDPAAALGHLEQRVSNRTLILGPSPFDTPRAAALALWLGQPERAAQVLRTDVERGLHGGFEAPHVRHDLWWAAFSLLERLGWALHHGLDLPEWQPLDDWLVRVANSDRPGVRAEAPDREVLRARFLSGWRRAAAAIYQEQKDLEERARAQGS